MARKRRSPRRTKKPGLSPGTLVAPPDASETSVRGMTYGPDSLKEWKGLDKLVEGDVVWVDVVGLASVETIQAIGERFGLHALALEDALNPHQRAKLDPYDEYLYLVARMLRASASGVESEQLSVFIGEGFVVTIQEREGDVFEGVRTRAREGRARLRGGGAGYLGYALIDALIDALFPIVEQVAERLEGLEDRIFAEPTNELLQEVHEMKREIVGLRRAIWPMREAIASLQRSEHKVLGEHVSLYLRDCYDHLIQVADLVESQREVASSLLDVYLSSVGHRQNEVMKVLTIVSSIFIPLSFLVGLYGMNFDPAASPYNMPELSFPYGYPALVTLMVTLVIGMLVFFRRRGWL